MSGPGSQLSMPVGVPARRPTSGDRFVTETVALELASRVVRLDGFSPDEEESIREQLVEVLSGHERDGYRLARRLEEEHYWDPDSCVVEILDMAASVGHEAVDRAEREWVAATALQPLFGLGALVSVPHWTARPLDLGARVDGEVVRIDAARGKYTVFVASLGHVREGAGTGTLGLVINFEDARPTGRAGGGA